MLFLELISQLLADSLVREPMEEALGEVELFRDPETLANMSLMQVRRQMVMMAQWQQRP